MSQAAAYHQMDYETVHVPSAPASLEYIPRSRYQWLPLLLAILCSLMSWLTGGQPILTDFSFVILAGCFFLYLTMEFVRFPQRFGIGGIVLFGGVLIWFCHDYFSNWFGHDFGDPSTPVGKETIAKAAFYHMLFVTMMVLGLNIRAGNWLHKCVLAVPEPGNENFYLMIVLLMQVVGFSPFFLFVEEPFYQAIYHAAFSSWTGGVTWNVFRTGNLNTNWGGYVAQIIQAGEVGGIFAAMFAILISRRLWSKILGWALWAFWALFVFNGGRRGEFAYMALPPIGMLFIKHQATISSSGKPKVWRAYLISGALSVLLLGIIQIQGTFRDVGISATDLSQVEFTKARGNTMFSEGLLGWDMIPDKQPFFKASIPLEGLIRPIPEEIYWFLIGPIPRALWNNKPVDGLWEWYNSVFTGSENGRVGTTISHGLVGSWYFNFGFWGVIEGGLLVGWLMSVSEQSLLKSQGRPIGMMMSIAMSVWLFRVYRDFIFIDLYGVIIGGVVLTILIYVTRPFMGGATSVNQISHAHGSGDSISHERYAT